MLPWRGSHESQSVTVLGKLPYVLVGAFWICLQRPGYG
jgi:hypothetical protein